MGDLNKNVYRKEEPSPYGPIITNPSEKDKREKEESYKNLKNATKIQIFAGLLSYFKNILDSFSSKKQTSHLFNEEHLLRNVLTFQELLLLLAQEDQSHNPYFGEELSKIWHHIVDDCNAVSDSHSPTIEKLKFFISQVQHFPTGADHTLGYYFDEYAGKQWIPFPFMELLEGLHQEFQASPVISSLQGWIHLLGEILSSVKKE